MQNQDPGHGNSAEADEDVLSSHSVAGETADAGERELAVAQDEAEPAASADDELYELEEFDEVETDEDYAGGHTLTEVASVGSGTASGELSAVSEQLYAEAAAKLKAYLSQDVEALAGISESHRSQLEKAFKTNVVEAPAVDRSMRRLQAKLSRETFRRKLRDSAPRRHAENILVRALRRSAEFTVNAGGLSRVERLACLVIVATSFTWMALFIAQQLSFEIVPWSALLLFVSIVSLARFLSEHHVTIFDLLHLSTRSRVSFNQSFALCYLSFSAVLWTGMWLAHGVDLHPNQIVRRQVVDIELVSDKDFADRKDILPGSVEKPSLKSQKNESEQLKPQPSPVQQPHSVFAHSRSSLASINAPTSTTAMRKNVAPAEQIKVVPKQTSVKPQNYIINVADVSQTARGAQAQITTKGETRSRSRQAELEEVAPPEMVEITENQGDNGNDAYQPGGHSTGGTGKKTQLVSYLKEIHRRIKHAWRPPGGETHSAEILFRIRKAGTLASIKMVTSSGDSDTDESAMHAIAACSPFKALPADYPGPYLDLLYTFNYNVDQLSEIEGHDWH
jgi:TonB family protein